MRKGIILFLVLVSVSVLLSIGIFMNHTNGERDLSWINTVNDFIEEVKPSEPIEYCPDIGGYRFRLYDNGSSQTIYCANDDERDDSFVAYMRGLMYRINRVINSSISSELFNEIIEKNRVLKVDFGTGTKDDFWEVNSYTQAYFILEDNLNKDLEGTIVITQNYIFEGEREVTLREIRK